jgi:predicted aspartyl protease
VHFARAALVCALVTAALGSLGGPACADEAANVLAKQKAFMGWSFNNSPFNTLLSEGTVSQDGLTTEKMTIKRRGAIGRSDFVLVTGLPRSSGFNGTIYWLTDENGFRRKVTGASLKRILAMDLLFAGATPDLTGTVQTGLKAGQPGTTVIRVGLPTSAPLDVYVNASTGAYSRVVVDPESNDSITIDIEDYREPLPGKKIIAKWKVDGETFALDSAKANVALTDAELSPPPPTATWTFGDEPATLKVTGDRIYVTATINGVEGHFVLDTGASDIVVSDNLAKRANLSRVSSLRAYGIGGSVGGRLMRADTVRVGGSTLSNVVIAASGAADLSDEPDGKDGLLGYPLFAAALGELNLDEAELMLYDPAKVSPDTSKGISLPVDLEDERPNLAMKLNEKHDVHALLDSGNPFAVLFSTDLVERDKLVVLNALDMELPGIGGTERTTCGHLAVLSSGPLRYLNPPACAVGAWNGRGTLTGHDIIVGFDLLKHFNYVFDYPHGLMLFEQRKNTPL